MRKLIYAINLSLDGCFNHTIGRPYPDLFDYYIDLVRNAGAFLYGRKTYQLMVPYWPDVLTDETSTKAEVEYAEAFVAVPQKLVFSRTLDKAAGNDTEITSGDLHDEVLKLKQQEGGYILTGGVEIPSQLLQLGLVDELRFNIWPILAGKGKRLFDSVDLQETLQLKLTETKVFESGCVLLTYAKG